MAALSGQETFLLAFDLTVRAGRQDVTGVLALEAGETVVITGPTGAGKTSLLRGLAGQLRPRKGHIQAGELRLFDAAQGIDLPPWRRPLGVCLQGEALFPHLSVADNLRFGVGSRQAWDARVQPWVDAFGLADLLRQHPRQLSGGQRQKVQLARTLALEARILLLDEPFGALDPDSHAIVRSALRLHLRDTGRCALVVSHTPGDAEALGAQEARLQQGWLNLTQPSIRQEG